MDALPPVHGAPGPSAETTAPLAGGVVPPATTARLFLAADPTFAAHRAVYGPMPSIEHPNALVDELRLSGLDGRGGAGFAVWRKVAAVRNSSARRSKRPIVVANGSEGEPLSRKDETLMRRAPHLVIDGLLACAAVVGATDATLYVSTEGANVMRAAMAERADAAHVAVVVAPDGFVTGEATAVANALEHGVSVPRDHVVHLSESGVRGRPTLVQNVETLAQLALIARFGAAWFRSIGTADEPGTRVVTVSGAVDIPQVIEVAGGTPIRAIIDACMRPDHTLAGSLIDGSATPLSATEGRPSPVRAVLVGGYHGGWVPGDRLSVPLSRAELAPYGAQPGAGVLFVLGATACGLETSANIAAYLAGQSAGQCGVCVNGLPAMADVLSRLAARHRDARLPAEITRLADLVTGRGSCSHPDGTARFVLSSLTAFETDVRAHLEGRCEVHG
ncbi:NADH-ubiquinone oxidoreductase-F iron-sulfur binding region domain-containing protein [Subtercola endophyticus]|uniref:NADH-ubiquinone oxidoreductase-F iron-sulfur binding region domain-containing protein n=1 Tax=Subtercola endophyticus TaxID=2895559 RepID=UPI001E5C7F76|nr:NADH-ubiquinone oxidoreductase-F iron-sulfur binding region domain-containing protein [Subtercola endophyticus]UFS61082.1 hypothetical protein LQ955_05030 [Subtercola endophyticus]